MQTTEHWVFISTVVISFITSFQVSRTLAFDIFILQIIIHSPGNIENGNFIYNLENIILLSFLSFFALLLPSLQNLTWAAFYKYISCDYIICLFKPSNCTTNVHLEHILTLCSWLPHSLLIMQQLYRKYYCVIKLTTTLLPPIIQSALSFTLPSSAKLTCLYS